MLENMSSEDSVADLTDMNNLFPTTVQREILVGTFSSGSLDAPTKTKKVNSVYRSFSQADTSKKNKIRLKASKSFISFKDLRKLSRKTDSFCPHMEPMFEIRSRRKSSPLSLFQTQAQSISVNDRDTHATQKEEIKFDTVDRNCHYDSYSLIVDLSQGEEKSSTILNSNTSESNTNRVDNKLIAEHKKPTTSKIVFSASNQLCKVCGQSHRVSENHEYDYENDIDDDLLCDICLQPFVDPYDTRCGHTFCCVCLRNYARLMKKCPVDRAEIKFVSDCWKSSLVMRKLVDKLEVQCPNKIHCQTTMQRCTLEAHLKERCPGTIIRCRHAIFGCNFRGIRVDEKDHLNSCRFKSFKGNPLELLYPTYTKHMIELFRPDEGTKLGLTIVGGNDTPIRNIVVRSVLPESLVDIDGRIRPGDVIIEVNGEDFHSISHVEARASLCRSSRLVRFTLMRESFVEPESILAEKKQGTGRQVSVNIHKPPNEQLGIKLSSYADGKPGIYIQEIIPGGAAHSSGLLQVGDQISKVSQIDLSNANLEIAAYVIQSVGETIDMIVYRYFEENTKTIENPWTFENSRSKKTTELWEQNQKFPSLMSIPLPDVSPLNTNYRLKEMSLTKSPEENLGIVVNGGADSQWGNLPLFVQEVHPLGVLGRDSSVRPGDLLISINNTSLKGLTYTQAINVIRSATQDCEFITLTAVELNYSGKNEDFALFDELNGIYYEQVNQYCNKKNEDFWTPSWKLWLAAPIQYCVTRNMTLRKNIWNEFGFSVTNDQPKDTKTSKRVFVKYVTPQSPAVVQGHLKCGDEILAIDGCHVTQMELSNVIGRLKSCNAVKLTVMTRPGSLH